MKAIIVSSKLIITRYLLALFTVVCGVTGLIIMDAFGNSSFEMSTVGFILMIAAGLLTALMTYLGKPYAIVIIGISIGLAIVLKFSELIWNNSVHDIGDPTFVKIVLFFLMDVFGFLVLYSSIRLMMGFKRNANRLAVYMAAPSLICLVLLIYLTLNRGYSIGWVMENYRYLVPIVVVSILFEVALFQSKLIDKSSVSKVRLDTERLSKTTFTPDDAKMKRIDLWQIIRHMSNHEVWEPSEGIFNGRFEVSVGTKKDEKILMFKRLSESNAITVTVLPKYHEGYINPFNFKYLGIAAVDGTFRTCSKIRMFGENGVIVDVLIADDDKEVLEMDEDTTFVEALNTTIRYVLKKTIE